MPGLVRWGDPYWHDWEVSDHKAMITWMSFWAAEVKIKGARWVYQRSENHYLAPLLKI